MLWRLIIVWNTNRNPYPRNSMVQISNPWGDPQPGNAPPMEYMAKVRRFLSNYFDLLLRQLCWLTFYMQPELGGVYLSC